ncbi:MAG: DUF3416 domain-containing protein [Actinomycetaceae bacterium]|nr:DUF3416 domain-containing protein [Actinomycetaceae bacterium]
MAKHSGDKAPGSSFFPDPGLQPPQSSALAKSIASSSTKKTISEGETRKKPDAKELPQKDTKTGASVQDVEAKPREAKLPKLQVPASVKIPRIPATEVFPVLEEGRWPAKVVEGEAFPVRATVFREGHDTYAAEAVLLRPADPRLRTPGWDIYDQGPEPEWEEVERVRMVDIARGLDRYEAWLCPKERGRHAFRIDTWSNPYATWVHDATIKIRNGVDVELMLEEGARILDRAVKGEGFLNPSQTPPDKADAAHLMQAAQLLRDKTSQVQVRLSAGVHSRIRSIMRRHPLRDLLSSTRTYPLRVDRERALVGAWYEIFPRSIGAFIKPDGSVESGTLDTAAEMLEWIAGCEYDVVYLTPIHPIGTTFRKGRNNSLEAEPGDPGSPYAIGSKDGGHDAIHPELGDMAAFERFMKRAKECGLEVAMDIALQCSPDHPWVKDHPQWFTTRADNTIAYAENPPKKYQDIYPLNFDNDPEGIYRAIFEMLEFWVRHGVTLFRVDNPHTKPLDFWQRLLAEFNVLYPDVIFLSEAFTRPAMMRTLGMIGFHQSYTYYTWRNNKEEITEYLEELAGDTAHVLRPAFWPATHDILTPFMQNHGPRGYALRATLAATGAPTWGIQTGYEFCENVPRPGAEEQIDNEKYEFKIRDWNHADDVGLETIIRRLNAARRAHPALQRLRNITFHETESDSVICFSKYVAAEHSPTGEADTVLVVLNLDPDNRVETWVHLDVAALGVPFRGPVEGGRPLFRVHDEITSADYHWGANNYVSLDPWTAPGHVFAVRPL